MEHEEQVVPESVKKNHSVESASVIEVSADDAFSINPVINISSSDSAKEVTASDAVDKNPVIKGNSSESAIAKEVTTSGALSPNLMINRTSSESTSAKETTSNAAFFPNRVINRNRSNPEPLRKIDLLLCGRRLKQQAAKSPRPDVAGVCQSDSVSVQLARMKSSCASFGSAMHQTTTKTSSCCGLRSISASVGGSTGSSLIDSFRKSVAVSVAMESSKPTVSGPRMQSSIAPVNSAWLITSAKSRRVVPTFFGTVGTSSSVTQEPVTAVGKVEPESCDQLMNRTYDVVPVVDKSSEQLLGKISSHSSVSRHCKSTYSTTATGPCVSEALAVTSSSKSDLFSSLDVQPSFGKSIITTNLVPPIISEKPLIRAAAPASQHDLMQAFNRLRQLRIRDTSPLQPTKQVESVSFQRQSAAPKLASRLQQGIGIKTVDRPVVTAASTMSAGVGDQLPHDRRCTKANPDCWKALFFNRPANSTASKSVLSQVPSSSNVVKYSQLSDFCKLTTAYQGRCSPNMQSLFKVSNCENRQSSFTGVSCNDSSNNATENECVSDAGLDSVTADNSRVNQKSPRRHFRGFATSSPLPDSSPPPVMSCSLSSISLASDQEDYDTTDDTADSVECDDEAVLLDIAFVSDDDPASLQLANSPGNDHLKPQGFSRQTDSTAYQKSSQSSFPKSAKFQPLGSSNCSTGTSRSCRFSNSRNRVKSRCSVPLNSVGRPVSTKRTRRVLSSSSESEDGSKTKRNSRAARNTRVRLSPGADNNDSSICLGPARCTKAICFNCHCH